MDVLEVPGMLALLTYGCEFYGDFCDLVQPMDRSIERSPMLPELRIL